VQPFAVSPQVIKQLANFLVISYCGFPSAAECAITFTASLRGKASAQRREKNGRRGVRASRRTAEVEPKDEVFMNNALAVEEDKKGSVRNGKRVRIGGERTH
jgi:hypothetical protein